MHPLDKFLLELYGRKRYHWEFGNIAEHARMLSLEKCFKKNVIEMIKNEGF
jgi:hypothetical protein